MRWAAAIEAGAVSRKTALHPAATARSSTAWVKDRPNSRPRAAGRTQRRFSSQAFDSAGSVVAGRVSSRQAMKPAGSPFAWATIQSPPCSR